MYINMNGFQYNRLTELCRISKNELSGIFNTKVNNNEVFIVDMKLDEDDVIKSATSSYIKYNVKEYLTKVIYDISFSNEPVYIRFHTHPSIDGLPSLSKDDAKNLKYVQSLTKKVKKINSNNCIYVVECIITRKEIAFYTYDLDKEKVLRIPFFVDGVEKIPSTEKSLFQIFKEGLFEASKKSKK